MRVFVALDIPEHVRNAIADYVRELAAVRGGARWVRTESMHVTLKFVGETSPEKVESIRAELAGVKSNAAVQLSFRGTGFFPNARHPRVFWAGIESSSNLEEIAREIEARLERLGIPREQRAFQPHLTLARFKSEECLPQLLAALERLGAREFGECICREFHLYESRLGRSGAVYTRLATFPFLPGGA
jgi:2'-5' RNA ligase